jgi:hypothetical protein
MGMEQTNIIGNKETATKFERSVEDKNGLDIDAALELLKEARRVIIAVRSALS